MKELNYNNCLTNETTHMSSMFPFKREIFYNVGNFAGILIYSVM